MAVAAAAKSKGMSYAEYEGDDDDMYIGEDGKNFIHARRQGMFI